MVTRNGRKIAPPEPVVGNGTRLMEYTRDMLFTTDLTLSQICVMADVTYPWLMAFKSRSNRTKYPSVDKIERLYECLVGKPLQL